MRKQNRKRLGGIFVRKNKVHSDHRKKKAWRKGSVTIFLAFLFVLLLFLLFAILDHVRATTARGYTAAAARNAAVTVYGNYNKELYDTYHLLGYGGYGLKDVEGWREDFLSTMKIDLGMKREVGTNLYRFKQVDADLISPECLNQKEVLLREIKAWQKVGILQDALSVCKDRISAGDSSTSNQSDLGDDIKALENYSAKKQEKNELESEAKETEKSAEIEEETTSEKKSSENKVGNPITAFKNLMKDGILHLVCDENKVVDQTLQMEPVILQELKEKGTSVENDTMSENDTDVEKEKELFQINKKNTDNMEDCKDILNQFSEKTEETKKEKGILSEGTDKICAIKYASDIFSNYCIDRKQTARYGVEYLIGGHKEEKDNLLSVINRLFVMRMIVNLSYVESNEQFRAESLTTATAIAGIAGVPAVITAVQHTILLILAMEESCIDITALLEERCIPLYKTMENFQMKYGEIVSCTRTFFQKKASVYTKNRTGNPLQTMKYENFLEIMMSVMSQDKLLNRMCQLIQYDLRERYNKTFSLNKCIAGGKMEVWYQLPYFFPIVSEERGSFFARGAIQNHIILSYRYK